MVKSITPELTQLALRLMGIAINSAGNERLFSQMGLTHTKLRNRLGHAKVTLIAKLRQELHRHRQGRKRKAVVAASDTGPSTRSNSDGPRTAHEKAQDQLMDEDALTSAEELRLTFNAYFAEIDEENRAAGVTEEIPAYIHSAAILKTTLSSVFGSTLLPLLTEESLGFF